MLVSEMNGSRLSMPAGRTAMICSWGPGVTAVLYYKRKGNVYLWEKDVHTYRRTELFNLSRAGGAVRAG